MDFTNVKEFMDRLTSWRIPGNCIVIRYKGEKFKYCSGYEDLENKIPMRGEKLFNIFSCSKVATATAALQLYEKGLFLLDDPLYEYIPEYKDMYVKRQDGELEKANSPITIRQLLTMTSGIDYTVDEKLVNEVKEKTDGKMNTMEVVKAFSKKTLIFHPGEEFKYGWNHDILGGFIEVVSGKKFRDYMKENIFAPLEMYNTGFHIEGIEDKVAKLYRFIDGNEADSVNLQQSDRSGLDGHIVETHKLDGRKTYGEEFDGGGGGIITSVDDYSKFVAALANFGEGLNGERILAKGTVELLRENQLTESQMKTFKWQQHKGYGYGLGVRTMTNRALSGSNGSFKEFGWGGAAGATVICDADIGLSVFYAHHMLNPQETYYQPRLRNAVYSCL